MKRQLLGVRVSRRAIGLVCLSDETLTMSVGRHVMSARKNGIVGALRFIDRVLTQSQANAVAIDAPSLGANTRSMELLNGIKSILSSRGITPMVVGKPEILHAFGVGSIRTRDDVRKIVNGFWPDLIDVRGCVQPFVADAAAVALYSDCTLALERQTI